MKDFPDHETKDQWKNNPDNYIWGLFYFNKSDPRIILPKRLEGFGWTLNFGNPWTVVVLLISALCALGCVLNI